MKFKKPRGILLGIGLGSFVVSVALFFVVPIICGEGFQYNGGNALLEGIKGLITFNFANVLYTALFILFVLAFAVLVTYFVTSIGKKHGIHTLIAFISLIFIFGSYVIVSSFFLVNVEFNGVSGKLLESMLKADGQMLGKILSSVALAFAILSNVLLIIHAFVCMISMEVTKEIKDFEDEIEAKKEQEFNEKVAELVANPPVVASADNSCVCCMSSSVESDPINECVQETTKEENDEFEVRKQREDKLFKECLDSGYFTEYEELEFPEPLEGFDEEPVCEKSEIEESSAFIRKTSIHIGFTHD